MTMTSNRRKQRAASAERAGVADRETRPQILEAAQALFIDHGYKGVSMKDVAEAVAITPAALYYHFPGGKEELFADTIRHFLQSTVERAFQAMESATTFRARLRQLTRNGLSTPVDRLAPLLRDAFEYLKGDHLEIGREVERGYTSRMAMFFQEAIDTGELVTDLPADLLVTLYQGMCNALLSQRYFRGAATQPASEEQLAETVVAVFLDGVGRAPPLV